MILHLKRIEKKLSLFLSILFLLLFILIFPIYGEGEKIILTKEDIITLNRIDILAYPTIFLNVMVSDKNGNPVEGLGIDDFTVSENGTIQKVDEVITASQKGAPVTILFTMDASASMGDENLIFDKDGFKKVRPIDHAKEAAKLFISRLKEKDKVIVTGFAEYWLSLNKITDDRSMALNAIDKLEPEGETALFEAISSSVNLIKQEEGNKAVIVLTDGKDTRAGLTLEDCINNIKISGVPVFTIGLGNDIDDGNLLMISQITGGRFFKAPDSSKLKEIYELILTQLEKQYWIKYSISKSHPIGSMVEVTVNCPSRGIKQPGSLNYMTPAQVNKRIIEFSIGLVAVILLTVILFQLLWKGFGLDPVIASYLSILISIFLAVGLFTFLFFGVFIYYKKSLQVFLTLGVVTILAIVFVIWRIKDYA